MRLNVYAEELTPYVEMVTKTADTGMTFYGIRFYIQGAPGLHRGEEDNDESAITFWANATPTPGVRSPLEHREAIDKMPLALLDALFSRGTLFVNEALRQLRDGETPHGVKVEEVEPQS